MRFFTTILSLLVFVSNLESYFDKKTFQPLESRQLHTIEKQEYLIDKEESINFVVVAHVDCLFQQKMIDKVLNFLQEYQFSLSAAIHENDYPVFISTNQKLQCEYRQYNYSLKEEILAELYRRFNPQKGPLMRVIAFVDNGEMDFIFTFHHAIADGISATELVKQFFSRLKDVPSLHLSSQKHLASDQLKKGEMNFQQIQLEQEELKIVLNRCHDKKISLSCLVAILLGQELQQVLPNEKKELMAYRFIYSLRDSLNINPDYLSPYFSIFDLPSKSYNSFSLNAQMQMLTSDYKNAMATYNAEKYIEELEDLLQKTSSEALFQLIEDKVPLVTVNNLGRVQLHSDCSFVKSLFFIPAIKAFIRSNTHYQISMNSFQGKLFINFLYIDPLFKTEEVNQLILNIKQKMISFANNSN